MNLLSSHARYEKVCVQQVRSNLILHRTLRQAQCRQRLCRSRTACFTRNGAIMGSTLAGIAGGVPIKWCFEIPYDQPWVG